MREKRTETDEKEDPEIETRMQCTKYMAWNWCKSLSKCVTAKDRENYDNFWTMINRISQFPQCCYCIHCCCVTHIHTCIIAAEWQRKRKKKQTLSRKHDLTLACVCLPAYVHVNYLEDYLLYIPQWLNIMALPMAMAMAFPKKSGRNYGMNKTTAHAKNQQQQTRILTMSGQ